MLVLSAFVAEYGPILIMLEDLHLFDTVSLQLVADAAKSLSQGCLIMASMRPDAGIFKPPNVNQVRLHSTSENHTSNGKLQEGPLHAWHLTD